nr:MBL fold metallo-hydrolase [Lysinibacillus timonensis]
MNIHKITIPTPYSIGDVNAFLVKGDALTLFDVGPKTDEAYKAVKKGISEAGYQLEDIEQIVLTHHHPDHSGWIDAFPNSTILGHQYTDYWIRKSKDFLIYIDEFYKQELMKQAVPKSYIEKIIYNRMNDLEYMGTIPLTGFLDDGDEVPGHPGLKTFYTPGHAQSHLVFLDVHSNTVIGGDLLLEQVASNPLVEPPVDLSNNRPKSMIQYQNSLRLLSSLQVNRVFTGHGNEVTNVTELITKRLERDQMRSKQVYSLLNKPKSVFEVMKQLYASIYQTELGLTLSKTIGYLDLLENEGLVYKKQQEDIMIYSRV